MGEAQEETGRAMRARTLQRITAYTDGVVAIALTLLALPLVNIAERSGAGEPLLHLLAANRGDLLAAGVTFLLITQFLRSHRHLYEELVDYDETLLTLNTFWLMSVLFLPIPTARLFTESRLRADSAVFYLGTMFVTVLLSLVQIWWVRRHPALLRRSAERPPALLPAAASCVTFAAAALTAAFSPLAGLLLLIAMPLALYVTTRVTRRG